jgi:ABC-type amino acid transport substrate-binding protein
MRALLAGAVSVGLLAILVLGGISLGPLLLPAVDNPKLAFTLDPRLTQGVTVEVQRAPIGGGSPAAPRGELTLSTIQNSGVLRVGYNPNVIPFSYWNDRGDLVGFDISYAYELARDLNVKLEFLPYDWRDLSRDLVQGRFDIAMSGIYVTDDRLQTLIVSDSYYQSPMALLVRSERAREFLDRAAVAAMPNLRLVVFDDPVLVPIVRYQFPKANVRVVKDYSVLPAMADQFDAAIWTLQQASAWAASHPGFTAVRPAALGNPLLFAYLLPPGADSFRQFLDQWLALHVANGFRAAQLDYWIDGKPRAGERRPRWNLFDALMTEAAR